MLTRVLGLRMKEVKALPPESTQKVLGINMSIQEEGIILAPHPKRCRKVMDTIDQALTSNSLTADQAHRLTGKLIFLTSTLFGQLGRAALQPLYSRAHGQQVDPKTDNLNWPLRSAVKTLKKLLEEIHPRFIPRALQQPVMIIYTDAYFVLDGQHIPVGSHAAGRVPPWLLKKFCSRKTYIYFLEVLAQLIAFLNCPGIPTTMVVSFIDNTSGLFAFRKGYCKDESICNMIALTWRVIAALGWHLHLEWVASELNISDKVSRHEFTEMEQIEATEDHPQLESLFEILKKVSEDSEYAHGDALSEVLKLSTQQSSSTRTGEAVNLAPVRDQGSPRCDLSRRNLGEGQTAPEGHEKGAPV
eukprot:s2661_g9.t1